MEYPFESLENEEKAFSRDEQAEYDRETHSKCCGDIEPAIERYDRDASPEELDEEFKQDIENK